MNTVYKPTEFASSDMERKCVNSLSVSFRDNVEVFPHINIDSFQNDEVDQTWYSATEIAMIRQECNQTARSLPPHHSLRDTIDGECLRGLEYRTYEGARLRMRRKLNAWDAVELEQERQWDCGYFDADSLAATYMSSTAGSLRDAQLMAQRDESFVHDNCIQ